MAAPRYYAYKVGLGIINREMTALGTGEDVSDAAAGRHAFAAPPPPHRRSPADAAQWHRSTRGGRSSRAVSSRRRAATRGTGCTLGATRRGHAPPARPSSSAMSRAAATLRAPAVPARVVDGRRRRALRQARRPPPPKIAAAAGHRADQHARLLSSPCRNTPSRSRTFVAWLEHARVAVGVRRELERQHQTNSRSAHRSRARAAAHVTYTGWRRLAAQTVELKRLSESAHLMLCKSRAFELEAPLRLSQHRAARRSAFAFARDRGLGAAMTCGGTRRRWARSTGLALVLCGRRSTARSSSRCVRGAPPPSTAAAWRPPSPPPSAPPRPAASASRSGGSRVRSSARRHRLTFSRAQRLVCALSQLRANQAVAGSCGGDGLGIEHGGGSFPSVGARAARPRRDRWRGGRLHRLERRLPPLAPPRGRATGRSRGGTRPSSNGRRRSR